VENPSLPAHSSLSLRAHPPLGLELVAERSESKTGRQATFAEADPEGVIS